MSNTVVIEARILEVAEKIHEMVESGKYDKYMDAIDAELSNYSVYFRDKVLSHCYSKYFKEVLGRCKKED